MHIHFDYFGHSKPNGSALINLVKLSDISDHGMLLQFHHTFDVKEYNRILAAEKRNKMTQEQKIDRKTYMQEYNQHGHVKKNKRKKNREYYQKHKEDIKNRRKNIKQNIVKERMFDIKEKNYWQDPSVKEQNRIRMRYKRYLSKNNITTDDLSFEDFMKTC